MDIDYRKMLDNLKGECDRFLSAYNEDSTMRSSREAFETIISLLSTFASQDKKTCPRCKKTHPILRPMLIEVKDSSVKIVSVELHSKVLLLVNKTKEEALQDMVDVPEGLPRDLVTAFVASFIIRPIETSLEELVTLNIRPFHLIKWFRKDLDTREFLVESARATQEPACA